MKKISEAQGNPDALNRLAAQRQMYSAAKNLQYCQLIIAVPITVAIFILAVILPSFQEFANIWGIVLLLLEIGILRRIENNLHHRAARIQELFDCEVLGIPWNDVKCRSKPDPEDIVDYSEKYLKNAGNLDELKNWYSPEVDKLPVHLGRIACQRSNVTWESRLRRRYATAISIVMTLLALTIISISIVRNLNIGSTFLNLVVPLLPAFGWGIPQIKGNLGASRNLDSLKELIDTIWHNGLSLRITTEKLAEAARKVQDEIYDHRRSAPLVPDRIYRFFRSKDDNLMYKGTAELVGEAIKLLDDNKDGMDGHAVSP